MTEAAAVETSANTTVQTMPAEAEAPETAAPAEAPAEAAPSDLDVARRFEAVKQADARAVRAKQEAKRLVDEAKREREEAKRDREEAARLRAEAEKEHGLLNDDPIAWAEQRKADPDNLAKRFLKPVSPEEKLIRELQSRLDQIENAGKEREETAAKQRTEAETEHRTRAFVGEITAEECPNLVALYEPWEAAQLYSQALAQHGAEFRKEFGREPTNAEVRRYLEQEVATPRAERVRKSLTGQQAPVSKPSDGDGQLENGSGHQATNGPSTLTNNHAAQAASSGKPRVETREERLARLAAQLEAEERDARH